MKVVNTKDLAEELRISSTDAKLWIYNSFDVMIPHEVNVEVDRRLNSRQRAIYAFERNLQGPAMSMMFNGVHVDLLMLQRETNRAKKELQDLQDYVRGLAVACWGDGINVKSPTQMKNLFYESPNGFKLKPIYEGTGNKRHVTCNRKALEKISATNYYTRPLINAILSLKDIQSEINFLERGVEDDGRVHCSFNVSATETGRWSSSSNPWGRGANFQNQGEKTRSIYIADPEYIFAYPDLRQAESRAVAYYSGDEAYLLAVASGDLHTQVAKLVWPELSWPNTSEGDKHLASEQFYRHFSRYDMSKRGGHACNYLGTSYTLAKNLNLEQERAEDFHTRYHGAFKGISRWHDSVQINLQADGKLTHALGRERTFFDRLDSRETLKKAVAFLPQGLISDILKIGILRIWREFEVKQKKIKLFGDLHDGVLLGIKELYLDEVVPEMISMMEIPVRMPHGVMTIPVDFNVGYRWQKKEMRGWKPGILNELTRPTVVTDLLEVPACEV